MPNDATGPLFESLTRARVVAVSSVTDAWRSRKLTTDEAWRAIRAYVLDAERGDDE